MCVSRGEVSSLSTLKRFGEQLTWVTASLQSVGPSPATACWPVSFFGCWPELMTSDLGPRTLDLDLLGKGQYNTRRRLVIDAYVSTFCHGAASPWMDGSRGGSEPLHSLQRGQEAAFASLLPRALSSEGAVFLASVGALNFSAFVNTSCISPASNCTYLAALDIGHLLALPC